MRFFATAFFLIVFISQVYGSEPLFYDKAYFQEDVVWSGTVFLKGQNVVRRGSKLTILPGTVIKFIWSDEDGDEIGDGELTVEGTLIAKGTKEQPILFTSANENPKAKDWTYVQVSVSRNVDIQYCIFEYAFTGLQIHYSSGMVRDCIFRNNYEGFRFSTANLLFEHNELTNNTVGIRYESHTSHTTITKNILDNNNTSFFPVRKSGKTVKIYDNNIERSSQYLVKMGNEQYDDLDYSLNWWGTTNSSSIKSKILDRSKDKTLGSVKYIPFLKKPVSDAGVR